MKNKRFIGSRLCHASKSAERYTTSPSSIVASGLVEASTKASDLSRNPHVRHDDQVRPTTRHQPAEIRLLGHLGGIEARGADGAREADRIVLPVSSSAGREGSRRATATAMPGHGSAAQRAHRCPGG